MPWENGGFLPAFDWQYALEEVSDPSCERSACAGGWRWSNCGLEYVDMIPYRKR